MTSSKSNYQKSINQCCNNNCNATSNVIVSRNLKSRLPPRIMPTQYPIYTRMYLTDAINLGVNNASPLRQI